jgi:hypothetical protein
MMTAKTALISVVLLLSVGVVLNYRVTSWDRLDNFSFDDYLLEYSKPAYSPEEYALRKEIFETKLKRIREHNKDTAQTYKKGVNQYTDWTDDEFKRLLG